ncbi:hypothetical protein [Blastococcus sp. PRF04-17]|uniref:hypothetical protein n=1 Tax=Blastococcus sp. PRF04-17 TaxID=2933797 RepID=UPI001FF63B84|nr:hypothetical protein [Blastococcus sp. PRF04-17]UOY04110.1 hypothetical protein MVA48_06465 [Blastococcus sp. PRF04-17]
MLIDCDTCTARGAGCADCVVTVLLGAPPGWQNTDPVVVPMTARAPGVEGPGEGPATADRLAAEDVVLPPPGVVVEFDDIERRAVRALADVGLVPPLRHREGRHREGRHREGRHREGAAERPGGSCRTG